ncbi:beta-lactamase/transpeptidase-like protein [Mycena capillaripes]|nr:beta-lactamase/transpeptidase-like protein [Mycena capillaripes]
MAASQRLGQFLAHRFSEGDIDSLSAAVVSADNVLSQGNYGVVIDNECQSSPVTSRGSMYRIASVSKRFNVLEGHILAERGVISWQNPVEKYFPDFKHNAGSPSSPKEALPSKKEPITLFKLTIHMSGLGRDWPPGMQLTGHTIFAVPDLRRHMDCLSQDFGIVARHCRKLAIVSTIHLAYVLQYRDGPLGLALLEADHVARNATECLICRPPAMVL